MKPLVRLDMIHNYRQSLSARPTPGSVPWLIFYRAENSLTISGFSPPPFRGRMIDGR